MDNDVSKDYPVLRSSLQCVKHSPSPGLPLVYLNTFLSASFAELFTFPLDVTKTRLHLQGETAEMAHAKGSQTRGMWGTFAGMAREEGLRGVYGGLSAMIIRNLFFNGPRVVFYDFIRRQLIYVDNQGKEVLTVFRGFLSSCLAGCTAQAIANPLDIVKIRMQVEGRRRALGYPARVSNVKQALEYIYMQGGIKSMWKGVGPSCLRAMLLTTGDVAVYDLSKRNIISMIGLEDGKLVQFLASVSSGLAASVLSTPTDVVKSRIMNQPVNERGQGMHYRNAFDCYYKLITQEGIMAMYKGFLPCWLRVGPYNIFFWIAFEQLLRLQGQHSF
ncbi:mitochondrial uncoupling protein 4C-like [Drosophila sulfurigaster albostrigata]|uniref:Mitochondrial uncoupling protein 4C-like n=1 Tax=Drosophila albomicans TaxID=7291 RepID=A0A6P8W1Q5_DROAB|nr:mitochondrial uncoupling protein 4C-like [Drosophila albomicans]XP_062121373.1 mitochondrial uncoupling protein 4C-like [Drosophila sulfurigaster albostrigata]